MVVRALSHCVFLFIHQLLEVLGDWRGDVLQPMLFHLVFIYNIKPRLFIKASIGSFNFWYFPNASWMHQLLSLIDKLVLNGVYFLTELILGLVSLVRGLE